MRCEGVESVFHDELDAGLITGEIKDRFLVFWWVTEKIVMLMLGIEEEKQV